MADLGKLIPNKPKPKKKRKRRSKRRQEARRRRAAAAVGSEGTDDRPARIDQEFAAIARGF